MQNDIKYIDLISKYLAGEATSAEITMLEKWVLEAEENKDLFNHYKKAWMLSNAQKSRESIDVDAEWKQVSQKLFPKTGKVVKLDGKKARKNTYFLRVAAAILFLVAAFYWFRQAGSNDIKMQTIASTESVKEITLPDGSLVSANKNTTLSFPEEFDGKTRKVSLEGAAFFEVEHNPQQPFVIETQDLTIRVLGTSFYVDSHENDTIVSVIVRTGRVSMKYATDEIILTKGEKGIFHKRTRKLEKRINKDSNYLAWKTGVLVFDNTLANIVKSINDLYDAHIIITNEQIKNCEYTVSFRNQSLDSILKVLEELTGLEIERKGDQVLISGEGC